MPILFALAGKQCGLDMDGTLLVPESGITAHGRLVEAEVATAVTTVGAATLTAAAFVGGVIIRSGSTGAYSDTTPTATQILALIANPQIGSTFRLRIVNTVAFIETILAGTGVTLAQVTAVAASSFRDYVIRVTNVQTPAVTMTGIGGGPI